MKYKLIKELYDCFYTPPELSAPRQEIENCHKALIEMLEKPERRLVLQIIDAKDRIAEDTSIDSFISGFELAWQLSMELNNYKNERLASCRTGRLGARFVSQKEHHTFWITKSSMTLIPVGLTVSFPPLAIGAVMCMTSISGSTIS